VTPAERRAAPPLAFVTPWYGPTIPGGAEALTRQTAERLAAAGYRVRVLTTCIEQFRSDWGRNYHRPGVETINGVVVHRFPVESRDSVRFDTLNLRLLNKLPISAAEENEFIEQMVRAPALVDYLRDQAANDLFFFIPYLFSPTYFGAQIAPARSAIIPCLHDEPYARLGLYRRVLPAVRALVFNSGAEARLAQRLLPPEPAQLRTVIGMGLDAPPKTDPARFRRKYDIEGPFALYVGRREPGKNTPLLLDFWTQRDQRVAGGLQLLLAGPGKVTLPPGAAARIRDLGFISVADKHDAYAAATLFIQPSVNESFSIVLLESWQAGTPVLVHGDCAVTVDHVRRANGGLYFRSAPEFAATLGYLLTHPAEALAMGRQGRAYVDAHYRWPGIIARYDALIAAMAVPAPEAAT
jgi:glycosyltransferase involved in cell wall biosynthesis